MNDPSAHIYYMIDGKINHQFIVHGFYGQDIVQDEKLVLIIDDIHAELIFTNGRFSISCFYNESRFLAGRVNSITQLAFIDNAVFTDGEYYNLHKLGFLANSYTINLPKLNDAIRQYDGLLFNHFGIKRETDTAFNNAISDIYSAMSETISSFENYITSYIPVLPNEMRIARHKVSLHESYSPVYTQDEYTQDEYTQGDHTQDELANWTII